MEAILKRWGLNGLSLGFQATLRRDVAKYFDKERSKYSEEDEQSVKEDLWMFSKMRTYFGGQTNNLTLLEIGCGGAGFLRAASLVFDDIDFLGVDITKSLLLSARRKAKTNLLCSDVEKLPLKHNSFDIIVVRNLLHHLIGKNWFASRKCTWNVLLEVRRVLNETGYLLMVEQGINSKFLSFFIFTLTFLFAKFNILVPKHKGGIIVAFLTPESLIGMLENLGLRMLEMPNQHARSFYIYMIRMFIVAQLIPSTSAHIWGEKRQFSKMQNF